MLICVTGCFLNIEVFCDEAPLCGGNLKVTK